MPCLKNVPAGRENKEHYREILKELHLILYYKEKSMQKDISIIVLLLIKTTLKTFIDSAGVMHMQQTH